MNNRFSPPWSQTGGLKIWQLLLLVTVLGSSVLLAASNPSMEMYLAFVEAEFGRALDRHQTREPSRERDMLRAVFRSHSREIVASLVRPHTARHNWGLFSIFETTALDVHVKVVGIGGHFIPVQGMDDAVVRLGRLAF
ncbi:MAG TPA: DUF4359 domain-containing protein [Nitrospira sp.]|nr:DUF4359 domain-containing protein [Nitrospira sp.]